MPYGAMHEACESPVSNDGSYIKTLTRQLNIRVLLGKLAAPYKSLLRFVAQNGQTIRMQELSCKISAYPPPGVSAQTRSPYLKNRLATRNRHPHSHMPTNSRITSTYNKRGS